MLTMKTKYEWMNPIQKKVFQYDLIPYWNMMANATCELNVVCGYNGFNRVLNKYFPFDAAEWNGLEKHYVNCMKSVKDMKSVKHGGGTTAGITGGTTASTTVTITVAPDITVTVTRC